MTPAETLLSWAGGAGRWLWANRHEAFALAAAAAPAGYYLAWNRSYRPPPADPTAFAKWRRREKFAFAVWNMPGFRPKWWPGGLDIPEPPSKPPAAPGGPPGG